MRGNLGATLTEVAWVITAYAIGNVIIIPMTSWLSTQFGRRNYFAASIMIFTVCSFLCGNANGIWELVLFRFLQGIGGGALLATSQTIITEAYPPEKRNMAQAIYGLGVIVGPTLGPPLGGYIVENFSWPYIFYINIPIGVIATLLTLQFIRNPNYGTKSAVGDIDWLGIVLLAVSVGSLQYVLEKGQDDDWFSSAAIVILTVYSFFRRVFLYLAGTDFQKSHCKSPGTQKREPAHWYGTHLLTGIRIIWFHFYHSRVYAKHPWLDGFSVGYAHGSRGCYYCFSDAGYRDHTE